MSDEAARFRKQADEAREHAARVVRPLDKETKSFGGQVG
jgi:hypothetical protein